MLCGRVPAFPVVEAQSIFRLLNYLRHIGVNERTLRRRFESSAALDCSDAGHRKISISEYSRVYNLAAVEMQNVKKSLPMAAGLGSEFFEFLCCSAVGNARLGDALDAIRRYTVMTSSLSGFTVDIQSGKNLATVAYSINADRVERSSPFVYGSKTSALEVLYSLISWLIRKPLTVQKALLDESRPQHSSDEKIRRVLGVKLETNAQKTAFTFDRSMLDCRVLQTGDSLSRLLEDPMLNLVRQTQGPGSLSGSIHTLFCRNQRILSVDELTEIFHQSSSTLYRRLKEEGSSYQLIKDQFRSEYARLLLDESDLQVQEIGEQLGYRETGSFIRAFKSWSGCTPHEYRSR